MTTLEPRQAFEGDAAAFLEKDIKHYVLTSPANRLPAFSNDRIFDDPLVGFADGDDTLFGQYKDIIGPYHLTPREIMERHFQTRGTVRSQPQRVSVIAFIMPIAYATRVSNRKETMFPSLRWNHTRWQGEELGHLLSAHLVALLEGFGYHAVAPDVASFYQSIELPRGRSSNWSQRHAAYAAGLGTFSLSDGFITARGMAMRCGTVVTDAAVKPTPRTFRDHLANCTFYLDKSCRACIERCPGDAITEAGHDKVKCREFMFSQRESLKKLGRDEGFVGRYAGCGLCQVKVPCEARIPLRATRCAISSNP